MRLSHNGYLELILRTQRNASHRGGRLQSRLFANIGFRVKAKVERVVLNALACGLTNLTFELIPTAAAAARPGC